MPTWKNWSGKQRSKPAELHFVRSESDTVAAVRRAAAAGQHVRVAGAGHSHAPLVVNEDVIIDASGLAGVISTETAARRARVWAGTRIYALGRPLHDAGLALANQGDIDRQAIGGAVATGTHGTGRRLRNLSCAVAAARVVLASGDIVECSAEREPELFQLARLHLGAIGVVTQLDLALRPAYVLQERAWSEPLEAIVPRIDALAADSRHFEFFWYPATDLAHAKVIDETQAAPVYPLGREGERRAWSYEVLPNDRPHLHTEMEYSVPAEQGPACLAAIRDLIRRQFPALRWPVEYRTLAADDVWLSNAFDRDTVTISVHQGIDEDDAPYFTACEAIFRQFAGRPHWGKVNYRSGRDLEGLYPRWNDWWAARDRFDPRGVFLNAYLRSIRP